MKILLIPVSPKELEKITITSEQLPIGRQEMLFSKYAELSRRHAWIFVRNGKPYIADMGSSNGTKVNQVELCDKPQQLEHGDMVCFADKLTYKIEIESEAENSSNEPHDQDDKYLYLYLTSDDKRSSIDDIVVMSFPFMISKSDDIFSRYQNDVPEEVSFLSRRHAYISKKNGTLFIEDLNSTNGTFINGVMLDDTVVPLNSDDVIAFGGNYFRYRIRIDGEQKKHEDNQNDHIDHTDQNVIKKKTVDVDVDNETEVEKNAPAPASHNINQTMLVSSATSFLKIFSIQDEIARKNAAKDSNNKENTDQNKKKWKFFSRQRKFVNNVTGALKDREAKSGTALKIIAFLILGIAMMSGGWHYINKEKQTLKAACHSEEHEVCMQSSVKFLSAGKADSEIIQLASHSALKKLLPDWIEQAINNQLSKDSSIIRQLSTFQNRLDHAASKDVTHESAGIVDVFTQMLTRDGKQQQETQQFNNTITLLKNVEALKLFVAQRGGSEAKIKIDKDEKMITNIVDKWQENTNRDRKVMLNLIKQIPQFQTLRTQIFSHLRDLRNDQSLYLAAIRAFKKRLKRISDKDEKRVLAEVDRFQNKYPRIEGLEAYKKDIKLYYQIKRIQQGSDKMLYSREFSSAFKTALFSDLYSQKLGIELPEGDVANYFTLSLEQWRKGQCKTSIRTLKKIQEAKWKDLVVAEVNRQKTICQQFKKFNMNSRSLWKDDSLLTFYANLDQVKDSYFINQVESKVLAYTETLQDKAKALLKNAFADWESYTREGRIKSIQNLEGTISQKFKKQSKRLAQANQCIDQTKTIYRLLGIEMNAIQKNKIQPIVSEWEYQRQLLQDSLESSSGRQITKAKLELLMK